MKTFYTYLTFLIVAFVKANYVEPFKANPPIFCSEHARCPFMWPCCSQYGQCGSGPLCIVGCNPKSSYNIKSCVPIPALLPALGSGSHEQAAEVVNFVQRATLATSFERKMSPELYNTHHEEQKFQMSAVESDLNSRGLIHFPDFLITSNSEIAEQMLEHYDFTHSGFTSIDFRTENLILGMPKGTTGSLITSAKAFLYGRAAVTMRTSRGTGVITAIVFMSSTQDEIDFEFIGGELTMVQTNYYYQGELDHSKMQKHPLPSDSFEEFHIYEVDWDSERINWLVDGSVVRTLFKRDTWDPAAGIFKYPQTPMTLQISLWPAGTSDAPTGTIQWAGGLIDWDHSPDIIKEGQLYATVKRVTVTPYDNKFCPEIIGNVTNMIVRNKPIDSFRISYGYEPKNGIYNEESLRWYHDAPFYLSSWRSTGLNTGKYPEIAETYQEE
ncbi:putative glycosylase Ecym_8071 [Eremothecium cymbalariae DBVPG|uniref:GH16 domain-containing protein n=1 Tax=Eremothecium cymbalariae (strain CBS 270.75 / DBVPG 7215 / KCTC 17166 / NRRL Y-17582) TaxID=931890 RepID=G8JWZ3_ERECY|nr:Hypothetical protein Ecym_8071 [Eremothecium cymbalariae DBVPG\